MAKKRDVNGKKVSKREMIHHHATGDGSADDTTCGIDLLQTPTAQWTSEWDHVNCPKCHKANVKGKKKHPKGWKQPKLKDLERSMSDDAGEYDSLTALTDKHHSPLTIRKFTGFGFPIYVGLICDANLDKLDEIVTDFMEEPANEKRWKSNKLQDKRNLAGDLTEHVALECRDGRKRVEAVGVVLFIDKTAISSLFGDFMNHAMCRSEFYSILGMSTAV